jgi:hypothetical protein
MENVSIAVNILFILTVVATVWLFLKASGYSISFMVLVTVWMIIQSILGHDEFYTNWEAIPPRLLLLLVPPVLLILAMFITRRGRDFIATLNIETLTILHIIRIPVEITLYYIFIAKLIPKSMTFEGSNLDIISGITAPIIYYLVFESKKLNLKWLLAWNFICLGLLLNVVVTAILSAKTSFQQFAFEQPNIGVTYFPFVLLPSVIVPLVLFSHLASIKLIISRLKINRTTPAPGLSTLR